MPPVVEQRQEAPVQPRQRADGKNDAEHEKRAAAGRADPDVDRVGEVFRRLDLPIDRGEAAEIERDAGDQDAVVDELVAVPLHRAEACAHRCTAVAAGGSGGGRSANAAVKPRTTRTASAAHSRRWADRCERVMIGAPGRAGT